MTDQEDVEWQRRKDSIASSSNPSVAVFNANTPDGSSVVRALANDGVAVVAVVRVFTSKQTRNLADIPNVTIKVADSLDEKAIIKALQSGGSIQKAFLCLSHWENFDSPIEKSQAELVLKSCIQNKVQMLVFSTFEDTRKLRQSGLKSQIVPDSQGRIHPKFETMQDLKNDAKANDVKLTHMITSYLDQEQSQKSLCLIVGQNGKLIVQPHLK